MSMIAGVPVLLTVAALLAGCGAEGGQAPSVRPLVVSVLPPEEPREIRTAIPGQRCVFLVTTTGGDPSAPIEIEAVADGATTEVAPETVEDGTVAEVTVVPGDVTGEAVIPVTITVRRGAEARTDARTIPVWPESDTLEAEARDRLAGFTTWLATAHPDLGITATTAWEGSALQPHMLVVSHYQFMSEEWEAALEWHVMIAPHDWERLLLRRRWVEDRPSRAFEIASVTAGDEPREIAPPEVVPR